MIEILIAIVGAAYLVGPIIMLEQARRWKREARALLREARQEAEAESDLLKQSLPVIDDALQLATHDALQRADEALLQAFDAGRAAIHALRRS